VSACAVIVFTKAPLPGRAKTRLAVALGDAGAARLAERMMQATVDAAVAADVGPVQLCVTPDADHPAFVDARQRHAITITHQGEGDLGDRMTRAFDRVLASHPRALLIGTDAPRLDAAYLRAAAGALDGADAVFGPAADGGYTLVGLKRPAPQLFLQMRWSHDAVMAQTRQRLAQLDLRHVELTVLHDVDEPADLIHLPPHLLPTATKA